jgi:hypothetical protein
MAMASITTTAVAAMMISGAIAMKSTGLMVWFLAEIDVVFQNVGATAASRWITGAAVSITGCG